MLRQLLSSSDSGQSMFIYLSLYISKVWIILRQLLSSHDNGQNMVTYP